MGELIICSWLADDDDDFDDDYLDADDDFDDDYLEYDDDHDDDLDDHPVLIETQRVSELASGQNPQSGLPLYPIRSQFSHHHHYCYHCYHCYDCMIIIRPPL